MGDEQLELEEVKERFVQAESRLLDLTKELQGLASTRDSLDATGESLTALSDAMAVTAANLGELTGELSTATRAIEEAEPGAVTARLDGLDGQLARNVEEMKGLSKALAQTRLLVILTLVVALVGIVVVFIR